MKRLIALLFFPTSLIGEVSFEKEIEPLLQDYCFDCHGDGSAKGDFSMDEYDDLSKHLDDVEHWLPVWQNLRSQVMPPPKKDQPDLEETRQLLGWIEKRVFKLDPKNPDPGRVTIRRLNRSEYHYSIKDLLGVDYATWDNFPADDTGYGFDTIGDVLSISPLHMEKYLLAASAIVKKALPKGTVAETPTFTFSGSRFRKEKDEKEGADWLPFKRKNKVHLKGHVLAKGVYQITLDYAVRGSDQATDQSAQVELWVNGKKVSERLTGWDQSEKITLGGQADMVKGENTIEVLVSPKDAPGEGEGEQAAKLKELRLKGPLDGSYKEFPKEYRKIMVDGEAPKGVKKREVYAHKILSKFVSRAFRRPLDDGTVDRLVKMASELDQLPGRSFEDGIRHAMTCLLYTSPSPRD